VKRIKNSVLALNVGSLHNIREAVTRALSPWWTLANMLRLRCVTQRCSGVPGNFWPTTVSRLHGKITKKSSKYEIVHNKTLTLRHHREVNRLQIH